MEEIYEEIMELQRKGRYDLIYHKAQQLGGRTTKTIGSLMNIKKIILDLYDLEKIAQNVL